MSATATQRRKESGNNSIEARMQAYLGDQLRDGSDPLLRLRTVREICSASRSTVWRWIQERGLPAVRIGGLVRIRSSALAAFLLKYEGEVKSSEPTNTQKSDPPRLAVARPQKEGAQ